MVDEFKFTKIKKLLTVKRHHKESKKAGHGVEGIFNSRSSTCMHKLSNKFLQRNKELIQSATEK